MKTKFIIAAFAAMLLGANEVVAQGVEVSDVESPSETNSFFARTSYAHRFDADIDGPSDFATDDVRAELGGTIAFNDRVQWLNFLGYGFTKYDNEFSDANVHSLSLASILGIGIDDHWSILFGPVVGVAAENDADWDDAVSVGGVLGTTYRASADLKVGLALVAVRRMEEGASLLPIPMVDWRFAPDWQLYTGMTEVAARRGVGGYIAWNFVPPCELSVGAQYEHRRFRLDDGGFVNNDYIMEDRSVPVYVRFSVRIIRGLSADILSGVAFGGELKLNDAKDRFVADASYDPQAILGVRVQYALDGL